MGGQLQVCGTWAAVLGIKHETQVRPGSIPTVAARCSLGPNDSRVAMLWGRERDCSLWHLPVWRTLLYFRLAVGEGTRLQEGHGWKLGLSRDC